MPVKPSATVALNAAAYPSLLYVYPFRSLTDVELVSGASTTSAGTTNPDAMSTVFGGGFSNNGSTGKYIKSNLTAGFTKGLSKFACVIVVKVTDILTAGAQQTFVEEPVNNSNGTMRFGVLLVNGALGATGAKFNVSFRTGDSTSTRRNVNAGAGGTAITNGWEGVIGFDFDSVADLFTLYVNGVQEAQLSVAENAVANTNPNVAPYFLLNTDISNLLRGGVVHFAFFNTALGATAHGALGANPFLIYKSGAGPLVGGRLLNAGLARTRLIR